MAKNRFYVLDSDMHIMEPPDLWERYILPLSDEDKRKILWDNCARFYSITELPQPVVTEGAKDGGRSMRKEGGIAGHEKQEAKRP